MSSSGAATGPHPTSAPCDRSPPLTTASGRQLPTVTAPSHHGGQLSPSRWAGVTRPTLPLVTGYVGFPYYPLVRLIGPSVSACDHRPQKILGTANVDLGQHFTPKIFCRACVRHTNKVSPSRRWAVPTVASPDSGQWAHGGQLLPGGSRRGWGPVAGGTSRVGRCRRIPFASRNI